MLYARRLILEAIVSDARPWGYECAAVAIHGQNGRSGSIKFEVNSALLDEAKFAALQGGSS